MPIHDPQYKHVKPSTFENVRAGNRLKELFYRAKMVLGNERDAFLFIDKAIDEEGDTPRKLALKSDEGLARAIRSMDKHLVNS